MFYALVNNLFERLEILEFEAQCLILQPIVTITHLLFLIWEVELFEVVEVGLSVRVIGIGRRFRFFNVFP